MLNRQRNRETQNDHRGFSMVELMLVLAIVVVVAGLAITHFTRSYSTQYLTKGADRVRSEFARARIQAMRSGDIYAFFYSPGGNQFAVARYADFAQVEMDKDDGTRGQYQFLSQLLPADVYFTAADVGRDSRAQMAEEQEAASQGSGQIKPILFYGDGTSQNAKLTLTHKGGSAVYVSLRGLTGLASCSEILTESN